MKVITKDNKTKNYRLTLKQLNEMGFNVSIPATWQRVEYEDILKALETLYPELKNNIIRAYL